MTLTTHATVGAAAALLFPTNPAGAFTAAFTSHFLIDAIPHWDYKLASFTRDPNDYRSQKLTLGWHSLKDAAKLGSDCLLSLIIPLLLFHTLPMFSYTIALLGIVGGVLPDALQLIYFKFPKLPGIAQLQTFHYWIHTKKRLRRQPVLGIALQSALVLIVIVIFFKA